MNIEAVFLGISIFFFLITLLHFVLIFSTIKPRQIRRQFGEAASAELQERWGSYRNSTTGKSVILFGGCSIVFTFVFLCASVAIFIIKYFFG